MLKKENEDVEKLSVSIKRLGASVEIAKLAVRQLEWTIRLGELEAHTRFT